jgi:hypothetical protein
MLVARSWITVAFVVDREAITSYVAVFVVNDSEDVDNVGALTAKRRELDREKY